MRILDLDLDFFQNDIVHMVNDFGSRLEDTSIAPWSKEIVKNYLESNLCLNKDKKIKGRVVKHHNEAFYFWRELILNGKLSTPFEVVHVDGHADMGLGDLSWHYIMTEYLYRDIDERIYPELLNVSKYERINCGNYLTYAMACEWIDKLTFVIHPNWQQDLIQEIFKNYDVNSGFIQLKKFKRGQKIDIMNIKQFTPVSYENEIVFEGIEKDNYFNKYKFDFLILSISPGYTVKKSDELIDVIKEYIEEI
ncbi:hypothetical protein FDB41_13780 [Clostridium botulinum]|nr:hypothetical protein [Clostridium botulinum]NFO54591.1 hypothetical protein [Clostridium botulinum]